MLTAEVVMMTAVTMAAAVASMVVDWLSSRVAYRFFTPPPLPVLVNYWHCLVGILLSVLL